MTSDFKGDVNALPTAFVVYTDDVQRRNRILNTYLSSEYTRKVCQLCTES